MHIAVEAEASLDDVRRRQHDLMSELRDVDHWRRLVTARLDLAVAALTSIDEPAVRHLPSAPVLPYGLRDIIGLPTWEHALAETRVLERLRATLRDLDSYAEVLRDSTDQATRELVDRLEADPRFSRGTGANRVRQGVPRLTALRLVPNPAPDPSAEG